MTAMDIFAAAVMIALLASYVCSHPKHTNLWILPLRPDTTIQPNEDD